MLQVTMRENCGCPWLKLKQPKLHRFLVVQYDQQLPIIVSYALSRVTSTTSRCKVEVEDMRWYILLQEHF